MLVFALGLVGNWWVKLCHTRIVPMEWQLARSRFGMPSSKAAKIRWQTPDEALAALTGARQWVGLRNLLGTAVPVPRVLEQLQRLERRETVFKLARVAAVLANSRVGY